MPRPPSERRGYSPGGNSAGADPNGRAAALLLKLWFRIPPGAWKPVSYEWCALSGRGLCVGLITRPEESRRLLCVVVCDLETSWMKRLWPTRGLWRQKQTNKVARPEADQSPPSSAKGKNIPSWRVQGQICLQFDKEQFCDFIGHEGI